MKIYELNRCNRFSRETEKTLYMNREKAEAIVAEDKAVYAEAVAKGNGTHWANVVYYDGWVKELEVVE